MTLFPMFFQYVLAGGGGSSITSLLSLATELMTWTITQMGSIMTFIQNNSLVMAMFLMVICGFAVGFLMRIWRSVGR